MLKKDKILVITIGIALIFTFFYFQDSDTYFNSIFIKPFQKVNWDEVTERNIVKNSIPITLIEEIDKKKCKVTAKNFDIIIEHDYFVLSDELARELSYDKENETLILSCDLLQDNKSRLNVWYVTEESPKHPTKFQYFVTQMDEK